MLNEARIARSCAALGLRVRCLDTVESTNSLVKEASEKGEEAGLVIIAEKQTAGYGRQGRTWESPYGGVYFSLLFAPPVALESLPSISPALSFALCDALGTLAGESAGIAIKWPNDVVCSAGKLCGMSLETLGTGRICVGIGVNVFEPAGAHEVGGKNTAAYLADFLPGDVAVSANRTVADEGLSKEQERVLEETVLTCLTKLMGAYHRWSQEGFDAFFEAYNSKAALIGDTVTVVTVDGERLAAGAVEGVDRQGRLLLREGAGNLVPVTSGEVHLV